MQDSPRHDEQLSHLIAWSMPDGLIPNITVTKKSQILARAFIYRVACISCPSLFKALQPLKEETLETVLFEFDTRFSVYLPNFVHYDYNKPLAVPAEMKQQFDLVVADPPFLNEECLSKIAQTMKHLGKEKLLLCTGAIAIISNRVINFLIVTRILRQQCRRQALKF